MFRKPPLRPHQGTLRGQLHWEETCQPLVFFLELQNFFIPRFPACVTDMDCKAEEGYKCFQYMCFPWNRWIHFMVLSLQTLVFENDDQNEIEDKMIKRLRTRAVNSSVLKETFISSPDLRAPFRTCKRRSDCKYSNIVNVNTCSRTLIVNVNIKWFQHCNLFVSGTKLKTTEGGDGSNGDCYRYCCYYSYCHCYCYC